jgi:hypothetical protein
MRHAGVIGKSHTIPVVCQRQQRCGALGDVSSVGLPKFEQSTEHSPMLLGFENQDFRALARQDRISDVIVPSMPNKRTRAESEAALLYSPECIEYLTDHCLQQAKWEKNTLIVPLPPTGINPSELESALL